MSKSYYSAGVPSFPTKIQQTIEYAGMVIEPPKVALEQAAAIDNNSIQQNHHQMQFDDDPLPGYNHEDNPTNIIRLPSTDEIPNIIVDSFSEMVTEYPIDRQIPLVVLDSANIGWNYGNGSFAVYGLQLALSFFKNYHVEVKAFLPSSYLQKRLYCPPTTSNHHRGTVNAVMETEEVEILKHLLQKKIITIVPAGDSDDAYIINYARNHAGFIISNDYFQDHLHSVTNVSIKFSMKLWLTENRVSYTFVGKDAFFINPNSSLATRLEKFKKTTVAGSNGSSRVNTALEENGSPRTTTIHHLQSTLQFLNKAIHELNKIQRYVEMKQLILMKAKLLFEMELFNECFEEIQNILLFLDDNCLESKQIFKLLQTKISS